jgi:outer membrane protein OmpA-like peptidoglycan-associated protein
MLAGFLALCSACATDAGTGALIGAGGGAAAGAGVGAVLGGGEGALIGAGVGAAVGAGGGALIGHYMDNQQAELNKNLQHARVVREGDKLVVHFSSAILFDTNGADLKPSAQEDLGAFTQVLKKYPDTEVVVQGFTDSTGSKQTNDKLSGERAGAVVTYPNAAGVPRTRMTSEGMGESNPLASNSTAGGRAANRRVEVQIRPNDQLRQRAAAADKAAAG